MDVFIPGHAGRIQATYEKREDCLRPSRAALILPPHPKQGGSMKTRAVCALAKAFVDLDFVSLKINFRGVGRSEGSSEGSSDEFIKDAAASITWLQGKMPFVEEFWIAGFSFGAWMAINLIMRRPEATGFILVSPPADKYDFAFIYPCAVSGMVIHGEQDAFVPELEVSKLVERLSGKVSSLQYEVIQRADHKYTSDYHLKQLYLLSYNYIKVSIKAGETV